MDDIYIRVLKYARDNPGFVLETLRNEFPDEFNRIAKEVTQGRLFISDSPGTAGQFYLSFEDRSKLLEYEELHEARQSARSAMTIAIISILLTLFGLGYQFFATSSVRVVNFAECEHHSSEAPNKTFSSDAKNAPAN